MKTLHRYLLRQVVASTFLTAAVFTFVLMLGSALRELLPLLISQKASAGLMAQAFGLLIPFVWVFAMPMGMLTATLLVFGRFSADQELTAARSSGISLLSLISPILWLSLVLCAVSVAVNLEIAPLCRVAYNDLRFEMKAALANVELPEGRIIKDFPGYIIYIGKNRNHQLQDILIYELSNETNLERIINAPRGTIEVNPKAEKLVLRLFDSKIIMADSGLAGSAGELPISLDLSEKKRTPGKPDITDMTFFQLRAELRDLERRTQLPPPVEKLSAETRAHRKQTLEKKRKDLLEPLRVQIHRQVAFSFACFGFTLIGIPLGIRVQRRETNVGVAIALGLVAVYYTFIIIGQSLATQPEWAPHLFMWIPNFLFEAVGAVLLWRANRGI